MFWNVRSLISKIDSIRQEIQQIQPDILNINESWLHVKIDDKEIYIEGYNLVRQDRGVYPIGNIMRGTYVKHGIIFEELIDLHYCNCDIEITVTKYKLPFTRDTTTTSP